MAWNDDPTHPFAGILEKLKRTYENIGNLNSEITSFFEGGEYPILPDTNSQEWQKAVDYHRTLGIPRRYGVLSGEIVHHLRSCFDHVAWHFSSIQYRTDHETAIEFPVLRKKPTTQNEEARYERKVNGIVNANVRSLIDRMQPYNRGSDPEDDPLCIVHDMDRFDKHRELAIVASCANAAFPTMPIPEVMAALTKYSQGETLNDTETSLASRA